MKTLFFSQNFFRGKRWHYKESWNIFHFFDNYSLMLDSLHYIGKNLLTFFSRDSIMFSELYKVRKKFQMIGIYLD